MIDPETHMEKSTMEAVLDICSPPAYPGQHLLLLAIFQRLRMDHIKLLEAQPTYSSSQMTSAPPGCSPDNLPYCYTRIMCMCTPSLCVFAQFNADTARPQAVRSCLLGCLGLCAHAQPADCLDNIDLDAIDLNKHCLCNSCDSTCSYAVATVQMCRLA